MTKPIVHAMVTADIVCTNSAIRSPTNDLTYHKPNKILEKSINVIFKSLNNKIHERTTLISIKKRYMTLMVKSLNNNIHVLTTLASFASLEQMEPLEFSSWSNQPTSKVSTLESIRSRMRLVKYSPMYAKL